MIDNIKLRETVKSDFPNIEKILYSAFGDAEGEVLTNLLYETFKDKTAEPYLSLIAEDANKNPLGHILFTNAEIIELPRIQISLLAPLAVVKEYQKQAIGHTLINKGLELLRIQNIDLVFVLGHPEYYRRCSFAPAIKQGFYAPFEIEEKNIDAWMMQKISDISLESIDKCQVKCATCWNKAEYWRE